MNQNDKNELVRKITSGIEIVAKGLVKGIIELVKAIGNAFR